MMTHTSPTTPSKFPVILHRKSTVDQARDELEAFLITPLILGGLGAFVWFVLPHLWPSSWTWPLLISAMVLLAAVFTGWSFMTLRRSRSMFECCIDDTEFVCVSPVPRNGDSFVLLLTELAKLERHNSGDNHYDWYVWSTSGQRYRLTENYDNPVRSFVEAIRQRVPGVVEIET